MPGNPIIYFREMKIKVRVPLSLHRFTGNQTEFECRGRNVGELLNDMIFRFPEIKDQIFDDDGRIRSSFSFVLNGKLIKRGNYDIALNDEDEFLIMQLVAGG